MEKKLLYGLCPYCKSQAKTRFRTDNGKSFCFACGMTDEEVKPSAVLKAPEMLTEMAKRILDLNRDAQQICAKDLYTKFGEGARKYLFDRGIKQKTIDSFGLGYIASSKFLIKALERRGYTEEEMIASGLFKKTESGEIWCALNKRIIFPIQDERGQTIGFGGRVMDKSEPKYKNSPETLVYQKRQNLYAWDKAKNAGKDYVILCEGYMDVIALHQAGFTNAVASLGTALTNEQAEMLSKTVKKALLLYDTDIPGRNATLRAIRILRHYGFSVLVGDTLPCKDPDEFLKTKGPGEFRKKMKSAQKELAYRIRIAKRDDGTPDLEAITDIVMEDSGSERVREMLREIEAEIK